VIERETGGFLGPGALLRWLRGTNERRSVDARAVSGSSDAIEALADGSVHTDEDIQNGGVLNRANHQRPPGGMLATGPAIRTSKDHQVLKEGDSGHCKAFWGYRVESSLVYYADPKSEQTQALRYGNLPPSTAEHRRAPQHHVMK
jgi:hypothetical protein